MPGGYTSSVLNFYEFEKIPTSAFAKSIRCFEVRSGIFSFEVRSGIFSSRPARPRRGPTRGFAYLDQTLRYDASNTEEHCEQVGLKAPSLPDPPPACAEYYLRHLA